MDLPDLLQLINLDLSEDEVVNVENVEADMLALDQTLQEADFGEFFR